MNIKSTIDQLFKDQLNEVPVPGKEALWEQMEKKLDAQDDKKRDKRKYILLFLFFVAGGAFTFLLLQNINNTQKTGGTQYKNDQYAKADAPVKNSMVNNTQEQDIDEKNSTTSSSPKRPTGGQEIIITYNGHRQVNGVVKNKSKKPAHGYKGNRSVVVDPGDAAEINEKPIAKETADASDDVVSKVTAADNIKKEIPVPDQTKQIKSPEQPSEEKKSTTAARTNKERLTARFGMAGGIDVFLKAKEAGGYAGVQLTIPVNKKVNIVTGAMISKHKMEENYSNAEKQRINPDKNIDARLEGLTVLQVPVLYEQPLPGSSVRFRAGLTPTYIIAAGIYNVSNSFTGNAANYRKFSIDDLHRLNVLFTASVGVGIKKHFEAEFKANYGLTELVKNSYINQSSVNNNFKSAQIGIIYKFGKKKN